MARKIPTLTAKQHARFWGRVDASGGDSVCWNWMHGLQTLGYGRFNIGKGEYLAHRISYEISFGEVPQGSVVMHSCDNRRCVNPAHLRAGTQRENIQDCIKKGRIATGAKNGRHTRPDRVARGASHHLQKGCEGPHTRLTADDVRQIRERYATGQWSQAQIGANFKISGAMVSKIVHRKVWRHLK